MKNLEEKEFHKKTEYLSKKIILLIEKETDETLVIFATLGLLLRTFAELLNMTPESFKHIAQLMVNEYREK